MKHFIFISLLIVYLPIKSNSQFIAEQFSGGPKKTEAQSAPIKSGGSNHQVNLFTGCYDYGHDLGTVSTPNGSLSYTATLRYSSAYTGGTNLPLMSGIPYGDGWNLEIPMISVSTEDYLKYTAWQEINIESIEAQKNKTKNYYLFPNNCDDAIKEGQLYWFSPTLNIPGVVSGRLIFNKRDGEDNYFVLNKFDRYVEAILNGNTWRVTLDDGTVYEMAIGTYKVREAPNQRVQDPCFQNLGSFGNAILPKTEILAWYCTQMYSKNKLGDIEFVYDSYGCFDYYPEFNKSRFPSPTYFSKILSYFGNNNGQIESRKFCSDIFLHYIVAGKEMLDLTYKSIPLTGASNSALDYRNSGTFRYDSLYSWKYIYSIAGQNGLGIPQNNFNTWNRYSHIRKDSSSTLPFYLSTDPYRYGNVTSGYNYNKQQLGTSEAKFENGWLESAPITEKFISGDYYKAEFAIAGLSNELFDINIISGKVPLNNECGNRPDCGHEIRRFRRINSTFQRLIKWNGSVMNSDQDTISSFFVGVPMNATDNEFYMQVGPAISDNLFNTVLCQNGTNSPYVCGTTWYPNLVYTYQNDAALINGIRTGNPLPSNFGIGLPTKMMHDFYRSIDNLKIFCGSNPLGDNYWWRSSLGCSYRNYPTYVNANGRDPRLVGAALKRYSKNPYMLRRVRKFVANGTGNDIWKEVSNLEFNYDIVQYSHSIEVQTSINNTQQEDLAYNRNVVRLKEIIELPRKLYNVASNHSYPSTKFDYSTYHCKANNLHILNSFIEINEPLRNKKLNTDYSLLSKITDQLGKETEIIYDPTDATGTKSYVNYITDNKLSRTLSKFRDGYNNPGGFGNMFYPTVEASYIYGINFVVQKTTEKYGLGTRCFTYEFDSITRMNIGTPLPQQFITDASSNLISGFKKATVKGPTDNCTGGPKNEYFHKTDTLLWGRLYKTSAYNANGDKVSSQEITYEAVLAFEDASHKFKPDASLFNDYTTYDDYSRPKITNYNKADLNVYYKNLMQYIEDNTFNIPQPVAPLFDLMIPDKNNNLVLQKNCNCYDHKDFMTDTQSKICIEYFNALQKWRNDFQASLLYEDPKIAIDLGRPQGSFNNSIGFEGIYHSYIHQYFPQLTYGFFIKKTKEVSKVYDLNCSGGIDSIEQVTEYDYFDAKYNGTTNSKGYSTFFSKGIENYNTALNDSTLMYYPSFQLYSTKTYSPQQPGTYSFVENYYLYDLINDPKYYNTYNGVRYFNNNEFPLLWWQIKFIQDRTLKIQQRITKKQFGFDPIISSNFFLYKGGFVGLDDGLVEEEIANPLNNWPCKENPRQRTVVKVDGTPYKSYPRIEPPAGLTQGLNVNTIPQIPGLDTLAPYIAYNLKSELLLERVVRSTSNIGNSAFYLVPDINNMKYGLPLDTQTVMQVLEYTTEAVPRLVRDQKDLRTRYYYSPTYRQYYKDCQNGREVIGSIYQTNFIAMPVAVTVGFGRPDSLRTEYTYRIEDNQVNSVKDPNGMVMSYLYDDFGRLAWVKRNGTNLNRYDYKNYNNVSTKNFFQRAEDNYILKVDYNSATDSIQHRNYFDPLGNQISMTEASRVSTNSAFDIYNRPIAQYKPHNTFPFRTLPPTNYSLDEQIKFQYENAPRSRILTQTNYGHDLISLKTTRFEYCIEDSTTLRTKLLNSGKGTININGFLYGTRFNKVKTIDPDDKYTTQYFNPSGQLIASFTNNDSEATLFTYNSHGSVQYICNPKNQLIQNFYNYFNLLHLRIHPDQGTTTQAYDDAGLLIAQSNSSETFPRHYQYDIYHRLTKQRILSQMPNNLFANNGLPWINNRTFSINSVNGINEIENLYNDWDRSRANLIVTSLAPKLPTNTQNGKLLGRLAQSISYSNGGQIVEMKFYKYDANGFAIADYHQFNNLGITTTAKGIALIADYVNLNNSGGPEKINMDYGSNGLDFQYAYTYDNKNRITNVYANYDDLGKFGSLFAQYEYSSLYDFVINKKIFGTGVQACNTGDKSCCTNMLIDNINYNYDTRFRLTSRTSALYDFTLTYDQTNNPYTSRRISDNYNGNITTALNDYKLSNTLNPPAIFTSGRRTAYHYAYDQSNRMTQADADVENPAQTLGMTSGNGLYPGDETLTYDKNGNILILNRGIVNNGCGTISHASYTYSSISNQLNQVSANIICPGTTQISNFTYNGIGNLGSHSLKQISTFTYERATYPVSLTSSNFSALKYQYGSDNQRIFKENTPRNGTGIKEYYFNDLSGRPLAVLDQLNNKLKWYVYGNERIAEVDNNPVTCVVVPPGSPYYPPGGQGLTYDGNPWERYEYYLDTSSSLIKWVDKWSLGDQPQYLDATNRSWVLSQTNGLSNFLNGLLVHHDSLPIAKLNLPDTLIRLIINNEMVFKSLRQHKEDGYIGDTLDIQILESPVSWINLGYDSLGIASAPLNELLDIHQGSDNSSSSSDIFVLAVQSSIPPIGKYYIYDHLNNTRVVYHIVCSQPNTSPPFRHELDQVIDYYPFGKILRQFTAPTKGVKFKSTQHERDAETDFDYRIARYYDSEIGRFISVDPYADKYQGWSPYNYTLNNPAILLDPDGKEVIISALINLQNGNQQNLNYTWIPGKEYSGTNPFISKSVEALNSLYNDKLGSLSVNDERANKINGNVLTDFVSGKFKDLSISLIEGNLNNGPQSFGDPETNPSGGTVLWNPEQALKVPKMKGQEEGVITPDVLLLHEFAHVWLHKTLSSNQMNALYKMDLKTNNSRIEQLILNKIENPASKIKSNSSRIIYQDAIQYNLFLNQYSPINKNEKSE